MSRLVRSTWAAAVIALAASFGPHLGHSTDDAFITYRYAVNLGRGDGLVFNPGEAHLATTAPGWATVLATVVPVAGAAAVPVAGGLLSLLALGGAVVLLARGLLPQSRLLPPLALFAVAGCRWLVEVNGHEGPAQLLLALLGIALLERHREAGAATAFAVATMVRPDAAVMGAAAGLQAWWERRRLPRRLLVTYLAAAFGGALLVWWLSGHVVPHSLDLKLAEATLPELAVAPSYTAALAGWVQRDFGWGAFPLVGLVVLGAVLLTRRDATRTRRWLIPLAGMAVFYPALGVNFAPWYLVIPVVTMLVLAAVPVVVAVEAHRPLAGAAAALALLVALTPSLAGLVEIGWRPPDPRQIPRRQLADWIRSTSGPQVEVAVVEIGFMGFYTDRPILDLIGLGSPEVLEAIRAGRLADHVFDRAPEFIVRNTAFDYLLRPILEDPRFAAYEAVRTVPPDDRHLTPVVIYRLRPAGSAGGGAGG